MESLAQHEIDFILVVFAILFQMLFLHYSYGTPEFNDCGNLVGADLDGKPEVGQYGTVHAL